ncbi:hypothetical protein [Candidatus Viadribacter manganicus]|uniref:Uncharacterized protein n=1 Tax=Candidatus Viadribacter manganicus TaxID=1759059 RepID=A0A1B1AF95_9PROT|nr:hypothetical protein [Candidatus Viadribacter manganicus]ANP45238.1 hypothetical protein ATE48_04545 [Candidatus Viadribacter manganicus]
MNAEQFISTADALRDSALRSGADVNASNYLVHAALLRALREQAFEQLAPDVLAREIERERRKLS